MRRNAAMMILVCSYFVLAIGCAAARRRALADHTQPYCPPSWVEEVDSHSDKNVFWLARCVDGKQLRCVGERFQRETQGGSPIGPEQLVKVRCVDDPGAGSRSVQAAPPEPAAADLCVGVACSGHGQCVVVRGAPACACDEGFEPDVAGINCVAANDK